MWGSQSTCDYSRVMTNALVYTVGPRDAEQTHRIMEVWRNKDHSPMVLFDAETGTPIMAVSVAFGDRVGGGEAKSIMTKRPSSDDTPNRFQCITTAG